MSEMTTIGWISPRAFSGSRHQYGINEAGGEVTRKRLRRGQMGELF